MSSPTIETHGYDAVWSPESDKPPFRWGWPHTVRVQGDLFADDVTDEQLNRAFAVMALCPQHQFQVPTGWPKRMREYLDQDPADGTEYRVYCAQKDVYADADTGVQSSLSARRDVEWTWPLPNVWLGVNASTQAEADERIPHLLETPAALRFAELTLTEPVTLFAWDGMASRADGPAAGWRGGETPAGPWGPAEWDGHWEMGLDWVTVGGPTGPDAPPCDVAWIRVIVEQCASAGVPCFVRGLGARPYEERPIGDGDSWTREFLRLADPNGADPSEWPSDLQGVRQMLEVKRG